MDRIGDLRISGIGKMGGGKFNDVDISGVGRVYGDVEGDRIRISGSGAIEGSAKATKVVVSGNATIEGNLESERLESSGNFKILGNIKTMEMTNSGRIRIDGALKAQRVDSTGLLTIGNGVEAEEFYSDGSFKVNGLLNANTVDVKVQWDSYAREIGGETIRVRNLRRFGLILSLFTKKYALEADVIEGTEIYLECTKAKIVRGNKVKIGPDCRIEQVEYTDSIEIAGGAVVNNQAKV